MNAPQLGPILLWLVVVIFALAPTGYFIYAMVTLARTGHWPGLQSFMRIAKVALVAIALLALLATYLVGSGQLSGPLFF